MSRTARVARRAWRRRGFTLLEILVVVTIVTLLSLIVMPSASKFLRKSRSMSAMSTITRALNQARLLAVKRGFNVCVQFSTEPADPKNPARGNAIAMTTWEDRKPDFVQGTYPPPGGGAEVSEVALGRVQIQPFIRLGKPGGTTDDIATNVLFNGYGAGPVNSLVVFRPSGGIVPPNPADSPAPTPTGGRGIYFADGDAATARNWFRVTVVSDLSGKPREEKYVNPTGADSRAAGYYNTDWSWQ